MTSAEPVTAAPVPRPQRGRFATLLGVLVSGLLLVALYSRLDARAVWEVMKAADPFWLAISIGTVVPITLVVAVRFYLATPARRLPSFGEAIRLTLVGMAFNLVLPSKSGDLVKGYFVSRRGGVSMGVGLSVVVYERLCDLLGLLTWALVGWVWHRPESASVAWSGWVFLGGLWTLCVVLVTSERSAGLLLAVVHRLMPSRRLKKLRDLAAGWPELHAALGAQRQLVVVTSIALWFGHMVHMWLFTRAVGAAIPFSVGFGVFSLALLAGQLPLTFAGFGARDVALVVLLGSHMPPASAAAIGLLSATRSLLPALGAVPIMRPYLSTVAGAASRAAQAARNSL